MPVCAAHGRKQDENPDGPVHSGRAGGRFVGNGVRLGAEAWWDSQGPAHGHAAQRFDPRRSDSVRRRPVHEHLQQSRHLRPARRQEQLRLDRARPRHQVGMERRRQAARVHPASGGEVARWQAVHGQGRGLHLRDAAERREQAPAQPARSVVQQRREGDGRGRFRHDVPSQGAAAFAAGVAGLGLHADLPVSRLGRRHAPQAGRHRAVQVCRIQDEREHQAG